MDMKRETQKIWFEKGAKWVAPQDGSVCFDKSKSNLKDELRAAGYTITEKRSGDFEIVVR